MVAGMVSVMFLGVSVMGGIENILEIADKGGRLIFFK
jgi:hypothetical protein